MQNDRFNSGPDIFIENTKEFPYGSLSTDAHKF